MAPEQRKFGVGCQTSTSSFEDWQLDDTIIFLSEMSESELQLSVEMKKMFEIVTGSINMYWGYCFFHGIHTPVITSQITIHQARLVLGWVTAFGQVNCLIT